MSGAFCCSHGLRVPPCGEKLFRGDGKSCRLLREVGRARVCGGRPRADGCTVFISASVAGETGVDV